MKDLEVRHCRLLLAVRETGGVGAAARALGVSQSTVSETLLSLERLLGAAVTLRRPGREAVLTPAAETLLPHARSLVAASEAALAAIARQGQGAIRLGAVESISSFLLPGPLSAFRRLWPQVEVRIAIGLCEDLRRRVGSAELDAALTVEGAARPLRTHGVRELAPARLQLVVSPEHPLAGRPVARRDLDGLTFLLADSEGAFYDLVRSWSGAAEPAPRLESAGSIDGVKRGVLSGGAVGVLPDYAVNEEVSAQTLVALDLPLPAISLLVTTLKPPRAPSPLESLIGQIQTALQVPAAQQ
jgi:molybdate transport repressor ModE-like protein